MGFKEALSAIHFILVLFFLMLGGFCLILPSTYEFRYFISDVLLNRPEIFFSFGIVILFITVALTFGFYSLHKHRFLKIKMEAGSVEVDPELVRSYLEIYWKESLPDQEVSTQVAVSRSGRLEIEVQTCAKFNEKKLLIESELEIGRILKDTFRYQKPFIFKLVSA